MENFGERKSPRFGITIAAVTVILTANLIYSEVTGNTGPIAGTAGFLLNPIQKAFYAINDRLETAGEFFMTFDEVKNENEELKKKIAENDDKIRRFDEIQKENVELKSMFAFRDRYKEYNYLGTNVINRNIVNLSPAYTLDKGYNDGVRQGMVAITYEGLAGQVTEVYATHSVLETISSENVKVSVTTAGSKTYEGILTGTQVLDRVKLAEITQLSLESDVKPDDFIVTSGIGGFYPPDLPVGRIKSVSEDKGKLMKTAVVEPIVKFTGSEQFYIVMPLNGEEVIY